MPDGFFSWAPIRADLYPEHTVDKKLSTLLFSVIQFILYVYTIYTIPIIQSFDAQLVFTIEFIVALNKFYA